MKNIVVTTKDAGEEKVLVAFLNALHYEYHPAAAPQLEDDDDEQTILPHYATE